MIGGKEEEGGGRGGEGREDERRGEEKKGKEKGRCIHMYEVFTEGE